MALHFDKNLTQALSNINFNGRYEEFIIHEDKRERCEHADQELIEIYGKAKWGVVDNLNHEFSLILKKKFDLYNWLHHNKEDEVAYFLNEAGSNSLHHSEFKAPHSIKLWVGTRGFVIGLQQQGLGFNAIEINQNKVKANKGAAFDFYRECKNKIFFDNPENANIVFMECSLK